MRADADFMVYVGARWPALVREAVRLGCPSSEAAEAVTDALSRCRRDWDRASREENVDRLVHEELGDAVRARTRARGAQTGAGGAGQPDEEPLILAPPTLEDLRWRERAHRRRTAKRVGVVAVPLLVVACVATYAATTGSDADRPRSEVEAAPVTREDNPAPGVVWYAQERLHLEHSVLEIDDLTDMTAIGTGVVYGDSAGRVVFAGDDGSQALLGRKDPDVPVAATDETGVAAWYDPHSEQLVAVRAATGGEVLRTGMDDQPRVLAVDGDVIYVAGKDGVRALLPTGPTSQAPVGPGELLDVRSRVRVFQVTDTRMEIVQSMFTVSFTVPGHAAVLAPDGNMLASRPAPDSTDAGTGVALYDTRSGDALPDGVAPGEEVVAFVPGSRGTMAYVVRPGSADADGDLELRVCDIDEEATCEVATSIPDSGEPPVLAR